MLSQCNFIVMDAVNDMADESANMSGITAKGRNGRNRLATNVLRSF